MEMAGVGAPAPVRAPPSHLALADGVGRNLLQVRLRDGTASREKQGQVFDGTGCLPLHALMGARTDVRGQNDIGQPEQRMVRGRRLLIEHVGRVAEQVF
jgi:hypothetical protein